MRIGEIDVIPLSDGEGTLPKSYVPNLDWDTHGDLLDADGNFQIVFGCFLIRAAGRNVLVDAGLGPITLPPYRGGDLPNRLADNGLTAADIDLVLLTHLHIDHIGWTAQDGKPFFPNAKVRFGAKELDQFINVENPDQFTKPVYDVLASHDVIETITDEGEILPGVSVLHTPGHTLGHIGIVVSSGTDRAFLLGDAVTCPAQIENADWSAMSDIDPDMANRSRDALYRELEGSSSFAAASHFPDLRFGRVLVGQGKRYFA